MVNAFGSEPEPARDDVPLYLRSARVERAPHGVTERSLHLVLRHVAVCAVDLDCVESRPDQGLLLPFNQLTVPPFVLKDQLCQ